MNSIAGEAYEFTPNPEDIPDGMSFKKGAHKHGYVITLTNDEQTALKNANYKLVTNFFYSKGDFYEILSPAGKVVDPYELQSVLITLGKSHGAWMTAMEAKIGKKSLWDILLPGTHNSGSYSLWNTPGCRCQALDIQGQLQAGVRVLDLRVLRRPDGVYAFHHSGHHVAGEEQTLDKGLQQIKAFAAAYTKEIVVVQIDQGHLNKEYSNLALTAADHENIRRKLGGTIGGRMANVNLSTIISDMTTRGQNIVVISKIAALVDAVARWDPDTLLDSWTDEQSDWPSGSVDYKLGEIEKNIKNALAADPKADPKVDSKKRIYASCMVGSADVLGYAPKVNNRICELLEQYALGPASSGKMIAAAGVDYIETPDNAVMNKIVDINRRRA